MTTLFIILKPKLRIKMRVRMTKTKRMMRMTMRVTLMKTTLIKRNLLTLIAKTMKMKRRAKENKILKRWNHREVQMIKESQRESSQR